MVTFEIPLGTTQLLVYLLHQYGIARQASGELHIKMRSGPVHKLMAAEMAVAAEFYHGMRPFLMDEFNDSAQYAEYVQGLVAPSWPEQRKYKLAVHPVENNHRHIAVLVIIIVEQRQLLRSVGVGIRVVNVEYDFMWSLVEG